MCRAFDGFRDKVCGEIMARETGYKGRGAVARATLAACREDGSVGHETFLRDSQKNVEGGT